MFAQIRLIYTINVHDIMRRLDRSIYSDELTLEPYIHDVHVDIYGILVVAIWGPTFLFAFLLAGAASIFLGVVHLELCLIPLLGSTDSTFFHLLLRSAPVIQSTDEASVLLMTLPPVVHLRLRQVVLARASVNHRGAQHAVEVFLI